MPVSPVASSAGRRRRRRGSTSRPPAGRAEAGKRGASFGLSLVLARVSLSGYSATRSFLLRSERAHSGPGCYCTSFIYLSVSILPTPNAPKNYAAPQYHASQVLQAIRNSQQDPLRLRKFGTLIFGSATFGGRLRQSYSRSSASCRSLASSQGS